MVTKEFKYYKHGYDLCLLSLSAIFAAIALQIISENADLFPGLEKIALFTPINQHFFNVQNRRLTVLAILLGLSCLGSVFTAIIAEG